MATSKDKKASSSPIGASIFGKDMYVNGTIYSKVDMRVDGIVEGEMECEGKVIMGEESQLDLSTLKTNTVNINRTLTGDISASTGIVIGGKGTVTGNLKTPSLQVDQGAILNGTIKMD